MAEYFVVAIRGESESSDAAVSDKTVEGTKILGGIKYASVVEIEAATEERAREEFRAAYPGRANSKPLVCTKANLT